MTDSKSASDLSQEPQLYCPASSDNLAFERRIDGFPHGDEYRWTFDASLMLVFGLWLYCGNNKPGSV